MPTFNQLVKHGRKTAVKKSTAPALQKGYNSLQKKATDISSPQKRGVCTAVKTATLWLCQMRQMIIPYPPAYPYCKQEESPSLL